LPAGNSWVGQGRGKELKFLINALSNNVRIWKISTDSFRYSSDESINVPGNIAIYDPGQLYKHVSADEIKRKRLC